MDVFEERYQKLNNEQRTAVDSIEGPVLVVAGPGSGKTELLSMRVANILKKTDAYPSNILCLTFTESAALNMRERLLQLIGTDAHRIAIHTFHSFGIEIMNLYPEYFHYGASFSPADDLVQLEVLDGIFDNLDYENPLKKEHPEQGYVYLKAAKKAIEDLKKAGLSPEEYSHILENNEKFIKFIKEDISCIFEARMTKKEIANIEKLHLKSLTYDAGQFPVKHFKNIAEDFCRSLEDALEKTKSTGKMVDITKWKTNWTKKDDYGKRVLRDDFYMQKMKALAGVYKKYQDEMLRLGYYDYDDMILNVIKEAEINASLRYEIQEKYRYMLIDEFQDTNDAQMRLVEIILDSAVNEGRPNIMAVGDDDQAIFKFQGAEITNIMNFKNAFRDVKLVVLKNNYRSTQEILDISRNLIKKGVYRLENVIPEIKKNLVSSNLAVPKGNVEHIEFDTMEEEVFWIANEIKMEIDRGRSPSDIAVIARRHDDLELAAKCFMEMNVPIKYERQQDVLSEIHIRQIVKMARFVISLSQKKIKEADEHLPEILSYPFWNIERKDIWELSLETKNLWIDTMLKSGKVKLRNAAEFFLEIAAKASHEPLEYVLSAIIGAHDVLLGDGEIDDLRDNAMTIKTKLACPFKEYYFSKEKLLKERGEYLRYLSSLKVFIYALREYKSGRPVFLKDMIEFVDMHEKNGIKLTNTSPFMNSSDAVELMTAHKAKGLEYETVYIINCQEDVWAKKSSANKLPFPFNLKISPKGDNIDDQLRLFYVAMTRAKSNLYITSFKRDARGKDSVRVRFIDTQFVKSIKKEGQREEKSEAIMRLGVFPAGMLNLQDNERAVLLAQLEKYKMSVTHLNNFLDVRHAGPQKYFEQNFLRFPQPKTVSSAFGTAMHRAVHFMHVEVLRTGRVPVLEEINQEFEKYLEKERLSNVDFENNLKRGKETLEVFYKEKKSVFNEKQMSEIDFTCQGVKIGGVDVSGKIDVIAKMSRNEIIVTDYKTGNACENWNGTSPEEKIKLHNYKRQLVFYKLLIENSREFEGKYKVKKGCLEFLEPKRGRILDLELDIEENESERLKKLIHAVYGKIKIFDFPDISKYSKDKNGILQFEEDLISGRI